MTHACARFHHRSHWALFAQVSGAVSRYIPAWLGASHDVKVGGDFARLMERLFGPRESARKESALLGAA